MRNLLKILIPFGLISGMALAVLLIYNPTATLGILAYFITPLVLISAACWLLYQWNKKIK